MLDSDQLRKLSKILKTNETIVAREYIQLLFLKELYDKNFSKDVFFKGGTCIRLVLGGRRFSEDLDFTVSSDKEGFNLFLAKFLKKLTKLYGFDFKRRKTLAGEKYMLTSVSSIIDYKIFVDLDFSFREKVLSPASSIITTDYPVIFTSFVNHLSAEEILAEKIRAILTRDKGRDIYDLWFLLSKNTKIDKEMINEKLKYYDSAPFEPKKLISKIKSFNKDKFILDVRPFVPIDEREKLTSFFDYTVAFLSDKLSKE